MASARGMKIWLIRSPEKGEGLSIPQIEMQIPRRAEALLGMTKQKGSNAR